MSESDSDDGAFVIHQNGFINKQQFPDYPPGRPKRKGRSESHNFKRDGGNIIVWLLGSQGDVGSIPRLAQFVEDCP